MENSNFTQTTQNISAEIKQGPGGAKKWLGILGLIILVLGIPLAVWLLQRTQIFAPKAEVKPIELVAGAGSCVVSLGSDKVSCASFPIKLTSPLGPSVESGVSCSVDSDCPAGDKCFKHQNYPGNCKPSDTACAAVITRACNEGGTIVPDSEVCVDFPSPCHVPPGWTIGKPPGGFNPDSGSSLNNKLISYWKMDDASGSLKDAFGTNNLAPAGSKQSYGQTGIKNQAVGLTNNIQNNDTMFLCKNGSCSGANKLDSTKAAGFSYQAWIKPGTYAIAPSGTPQSVILSNVKGNTGYSLNIDNTGKIRAEMGNSACNNDSGFWYQNTTVPLNQWTHLVVTVSAENPGVLKIYKNGTLVFTSPKNAYYCDQGGTFIIGSNAENTIPDYKYNGLIDEVGVWGKELTQQEVTDLYNAGSGNTLILPLMIQGSQLNNSKRHLSEMNIKNHLASVLNFDVSAQATGSSSPIASGSGTLYYKLAETEAELKNAQSFVYGEHPTIVNFTFKDPRPGTKQIWAEFIGPGNTSKIEHISVELIGPEPVITSLDCSMDISKKDLKLTLNGERLGAGSGKVKANDKETQILSWSENQVSATIKPTDNLEDGKLFKVVLTRADGKSLAETTCLVNTTVISLGARLFCREPGKFDVSGVKVTLVDENGNKVNEEVTLDKDGLIKGLKTKLQVGKIYVISVKAPNSLRRNAQFIAANGTNVITPVEDTNFILPVGDISPVILPDGKINTLDRSEIVRQWSVLGAGSNKTGDFNKDSKVNSIDWACMRYDFNKEDDLVPAKAFTTPSPTPSPSSFVCPSAPVCPVGKILIHGDPSKPGSCTAYQCIDDGLGQRAAYFLLQPEGTGSYNTGQEFNVDVTFWSPNEPVNLLVGKLSFDPSMLEVVKIERGGIINCVMAPCPSLNWTEDSFDNQDGTISLAAGRPSPGLQTTADGSPFAKITFKGKKPLSTNIAVTDASKIYANSDSTNILNTLFSSEIVIK